MSVSEKMTAIAPDIRGINGVSNTLGLDDMHNQLSATQETVDSQKNIIERIRTALQGKVAAVPALQEKTVTPTEEQQIILPDSGFDGLSKVIVEAMESNASSIFTATTSLSSRNQTITFNDLPKEPIAFAIIPFAYAKRTVNYYDSALWGSYFNCISA